MDIRPGPVIKRLIQMAIISKSSSYPPTNPFDNLTCNVLPIISRTTKPAAILVKIPNKIANPPITSSKAIRTARHGGNPILAKKSSVPGISETFGRPCRTSEIPTRILIGSGPNLINCLRT
jgi:hypothetical protein